MAKTAHNIVKLECAPFDSRVLRRHIDWGRVTRAEVDKHIKGLEDLAEEGESIIVGLLEDEGRISESAAGDPAAVD